MNVIDIPDVEPNTEVSITGYVAHRRKNKDSYVIKLHDITGSIIVKIPRDRANKTWSGILFQLGNRLRIQGKVEVFDDGNRILKDVSEVQSLGRVFNRLSELDAEMAEQASRMLLSRISTAISRYLQNEKFVEFESRVLSLDWKEPGLEPLRVIYPGFGNPASLATSPSAQVMEYLITTGENRAFTRSKSFSTTFRFPNGSAEIPVTVAKGVDISEEEHQKLLSQVSTKVMDVLAIKNKFEHLSERVSVQALGGWPEPTFCPTNDDRIAVFVTPVNIPIISERLKRTICKIIHVYDASYNLIIEGARETIGNQVSLSTITIYPSQFLECLKARPDRHLRDLETYKTWEEEQ